MYADSPSIKLMKTAIHKVARGLVRDFNEVENLQVSQKGPNDFVSTADLRAEKTLYQFFKEAQPSYGFLMEEGGEIISKDGRYRWIIDPLDGTNNFLHGFPLFAISIALEETLKNGKKQIIAAAIHAPIQRETFWAEKGKGAFIEEGHRSKRLRVAARRHLHESLVSIGSITEAARPSQDIIKSISPAVAGIRVLGSTALGLAYVAAGRMDSLIQATGAKPWDIAAGKLLIEEAGGKVTDVHGEQQLFETESVIASNADLHQDLFKLLQD